MLEVKDLNVQLGNFYLKNINLEARDGEYFVLLGPTGSGKSVLLETIAGLNPVTGGEIWINGRNVTDLNLEHRNIGFAYQDYQLYRHLTVRDNISFGLMWKSRKKDETEKAVDRVIELLGIENLLEKRPWALSGGESQKIALARAIAIAPELLILDEPLSAVDSETSEDYERDLKKLHKTLGITTIHVTHSFEEAIAMGDRIAVIRQGEVLQVGTPEEIFRQPRSEFVARFLMARNIFKGEVTDGPDGKAVMAVDGIKLQVDTEKRGEMQASIRPEDIILSTEPPAPETPNSFEGEISRISDRGAVIYITVDIPRQITCMILRRSFREMELKEGQKVTVTFKDSYVNLF